VTQANSLLDPVESILMGSARGGSNPPLVKFSFALHESLQGKRSDRFSRMEEVKFFLIVFHHDEMQSWHLHANPAPASLSLKCLIQWRGSARILPFRGRAGSDRL